MEQCNNLDGWTTTYMFAGQGEQEMQRACRQEEANPGGSIMTGFRAEGSPLGQDVIE